MISTRFKMNAAVRTKKALGLPDFAGCVADESLHPRREREHGMVVGRAPGTCGEVVFVWHRLPNTVAAY